MARQEAGKVGQQPVGSQERMGEAQRELLKRFHDEHRELQRMLQELRRRVRDAAASAGAGSAGAQARSEAEALLRKLEELLPRHFASEQRAGFLTQAVSQAPRLSRRAEELRAEYAKLTDGLTALSARMRRAGPETKRWLQLDAACRRFTDALDDHEHRENQLIHEAWVEDIGAVD